MRRETRRILYFFMASQPIPVLFLWLDSRLGTVHITRDLIFWTLAVPWGLAVLGVLSIIREYGLNVGRPWVKWVLAIVVTYGVHAYALKEIYLSLIVPVNFIAFPLLSLTLAHLVMRERA